MKKSVVFTTRNNEAKLGRPNLIKSFLPEWYKRAEMSFINSKNGLESDSGLKRCIPYMDVMISGYTVTLPFDIYVVKEADGQLNIKWNGPEDLADTIEMRPKEQGATMPRPAGHYENMLVFNCKWGWKTPKGYSMLVCHPFNRWDLPFTSTAGLMDSDKFWANGSIPFFIKENFEGLIPAGTPIAQLLPVKREEWKSFYNDGLVLEYEVQGAEARFKDTTYKKKYWVRKKYE